MNNNDWFTMMGMSHVLALLLPILILSSCVRGFAELFDPSAIESPEVELQKIKKDIKQMLK